MSISVAVNFLSKTLRSLKSLANLALSINLSLLALPNEQKLSKTDSRDFPAPAILKSLSKILKLPHPVHMASTR